MSLTDTLRIAHPSQHWYTGGIIEDVEWKAGPCEVRLWGGKVEQIEDGDTVQVFRCGLPSVDIVGVEKWHERETP